MTGLGMQRKLRKVYNKNMKHWITEWIIVFKMTVYSSLPHIKINKSAKVTCSAVIRIMQTLEKLIRISQHFAWRIPHFMFWRYCSHSNMSVFVTHCCWLAEMKLLGSHLFRQYSCERYNFNKQYPPRQRSVNIQYCNWDQNISKYV
jgi:hypothetical protein